MRSNPTAVATAAGAMCVASSPEPSAPSTLAPKHQPRPASSAQVNSQPAATPVAAPSSAAPREHERIEPAPDRRGEASDDSDRPMAVAETRGVHRAVHPAPTLRPAPAQSPPSATSRSPLTRAVAVGNVAPSSSPRARRAPPQKKTGPAPSAACPTTPVTVLPAIAAEPGRAAHAGESQRDQRRAVKRRHAVTARAPPGAEPRRADRPADDAGGTVGRAVLEIELRPARGGGPAGTPVPSETCPPSAGLAQSRRRTPVSTRSSKRRRRRAGLASAHDDDGGGGAGGSGRGGGAVSVPVAVVVPGLGRSSSPSAHEVKKSCETRSAIVRSRPALGGAENHLAREAAVQDRILGGHLQPGAGAGERDGDRSWRDAAGRRRRRARWPAAVRPPGRRRRRSR